MATRKKAVDEETKALYKLDARIQKLGGPLKSQGYVPNALFFFPESGVKAFQIRREYAKALGNPQWADHVRAKLGDGVHREIVSLSLDDVEPFEARTQKSEPLTVDVENLESKVLQVAGPRFARMEELANEALKQVYAIVCYQVLAQPELASRVFDGYIDMRTGVSKSSYKAFLQKWSKSKMFDRIQDLK